MRYSGAVAPILCDEETGDPAVAAATLLATTGVAVLPPLDVTRSLGMGGDVWTGFGRHWDELAPDPYAAELGVTRLRRYGHYLLRDGIMRPMPGASFVQPLDSNPLYVGRDRTFEPLTETFVNDPLLRGLVRLLAPVARSLDDAAEWQVKVHLFRVQARAGAAAAGGDPTPEGLHRDGVTLVTSLLVARRNAIGGETTVCDGAGRELLRTTLTEPGTLLLGDDRRTLHGVSPIRPIEERAPARRDVLVITFASG